MTMICSWTVILLLAEPAQALPTDELAQFKIADGFKIELFTADPNISKPIQMNFDGQGRLWIVGSESYPQLEPGAEPIDKVFIVEDVDHDGRADKSTVFADGLRIPTGIEIAPDGDGAYVGNATDLIYLRDTDRDGKADKREIVLTAFGTEDTHHLIHTFRWSPWNSLFFAQAVYIHSHVETLWGVRRLNGGGFWEFRPGNNRLDVFVTGMTNSWGIAFDEYGQAFGVDNDQYSVNYFLPGAHMIRTPNESHLFPSLVEGKPKYCGAEFVATPHFPDDWQGNFLSCDFRAHRLVRYKITDNGGGYKAEEMPELLSTPSVTFRPVDLKFGPDGALYVCDWFNPIINHGEVDFRDPRRDKTHGRIWRITRADRPLDERLDLAKATPKELVEAQANPSGFWREHARRALASRVKDEARPALNNWVNDATDELLKLRGAWTATTLGDWDAKLVGDLLHAKDDRVRAAAVRLVSNELALSWGSDERDPLVAMVREGLRDEHPRVRSEAVRALAGDRRPEAMAWAISAWEKGHDPVLDYAIKLNARESAARWVPALIEGKLPAEPADDWVNVLLAVDAPIAVKPLLTLWQSGKVKDEKSVLGLVARQGQPNDLRLLLDRTLDPSTKSDLRATILNSLAEAQRQRNVRPSGELDPAIVKLLGDKDAGIRVSAIRLVGVWRIESQLMGLTEIAIKGDEKDSLAAIESIRLLGGEKSLEAFKRLWSGSSRPSIKQAVLAAWATVDAAGLVALVLPSLQESPEEAGKVFGAILASKDGPTALVSALATTTLKPEVAEEGVKQANGTGRPMPGLIAAIRKAGGLPSVERTMTADQLRAMADQVMKSGDPHRGQEIYQRAELACVKCHAVGGAGGKVGPDLTTIGTSAPVDYLVESLLVPGSKIKENFHTMVVATDDGQVYTGIPEKETETELILRLADDKTVSIAKGSIEESKQGGSLMPTDVVDRLAPQDVLDLVRYLSELGKPGPFGPKQEYVAREWRLLGPLTNDKLILLETILSGKGDSLGWTKSLTTNDGWVYLREFALTPETPVFFAETMLRLEQGGRFHLTLEPGPKGEYYLDGQPLKTSATRGEESTADVALEKGDHRVTIRVDLSKTPNKMKLRVFSLDGRTSVSSAMPREGSP